MLKILGLLAVASVVFAPAFAQEGWDEFEDVWQSDISAEMTVIVAPGADEAALLSTQIDGSVNRVLDNGVEVGAVGQFGLQYDRDTYRNVLRANALTVLPPNDMDIEPRAQLETAYGYAKGGYGEVRLGRDKGLATRVFEGAPSILTHARSSNARLTPNGGVFIRTDHDLTGPALKVSYTMPRLLGVEAGVSVTPKADVEGLDRDGARSFSRYTEVHIENAVEVGVNASRRVAQLGGVRLKAGLAYSQADAYAPTFARNGNVETWSAGMVVQGETVSVGLSALNSKNEALGPSSDYKAWEVGVSKVAYGWVFGADYAEGKDNSFGLESEVWNVGAAREIGEYARFGVAWRSEEQRVDGGRAFGNANISNRNEGIVIEITLSPR